MAYIDVTGIDQMMARLADEENGFRGRVRRAMELAAGELREQLRREESASFIAPTNELGRTIGWKGVTFAASSAMVDVYAMGDYRGRRGRSRRAALVAAMVEYKHKNPWNERARDSTTPRINSILGEVLGFDAQ